MYIERLWSKMKKVLKLVGIVLLSIIGIYTIFVVEESIRLSNDNDAMPLIVIFKTDLDKSVNNSVTYDSIGFKLINKYGSPQVEDETMESTIVGQEFWLFDTFMLWGWIS